MSQPESDEPKRRTRVPHTTGTKLESSDSKDKNLKPPSLPTLARLDKRDQLREDSSKLRPKRAPSVIFADYNLDPEFPPTLAQFIDQCPDLNDRNKLLHQFTKLLTIDQAWALEDQRQRVIAKFPRAFDPDLTDEEKNYVAMLMDIENPADLCGIGTKILFFGLCFALLATIVAYWLCYEINLLAYFHLGLLSWLQPLKQDGSTASSLPGPSIIRVLMNPQDYSPLYQKKQQTNDGSGLDQQSGQAQKIPVAVTEEVKSDALGGLTKKRLQASNAELIP